MASQSHPSESISTLNSTPYSNGVHTNAAVDTQYESQLTIDEGIDPYIKHDLAGMIQVSFDKFLAAFSGHPPEHALLLDPEVSSIAQDSEIGRLRDLYCNCARGAKGTNAEKLRYGPFVNLANAVLKTLNKGEEPPIVFARNDPHRLMGHGGIQRVPDVVVVPSQLESVKDGKWKDYSNQNSNTSYNTRWTWNQILFTFEFKISDHVIELTGADVQSNPPETSQQQPPTLSTSSFTNNDYPATGIPAPQMSSEAQVMVNKVSVASTETQIAAFDGGSSKPNVSSGASTSTGEGLSAPVRPRRTGKFVTGVSTDQSNQPRKGKGRASRRSATPSSAPGVESTSSGGDKRPFLHEIGLEEQKAKKLRSEPSPEIELLDLDLDLDLDLLGLGRMGPPPPLASERVANKRKSTKRITDGVPEDLLKQAARYAIDQFAFSPKLRHIFNMQVVDGRLWIAYYDHAGVILTEKYTSFVDDLDSFVLLLKAMLNMEKGDRGVLRQLRISRGIVPSPEGTPADSSAKPELIWSLSVPGHTIVLRKPLARVRYYGLLGRASAVDSCFMICKEDCVEKERCGGKKNKLYAVKRSWPAKSRESEVDIIEKGRKALEVLDADAGFRETHAIKGNLVDRLPTVHFSADLDDLEGRGFRAKLGVFLGDLENRVWRIIVFDILVPIHDLEDINDFKQCIRDIFQVLHFLWIIAKIMHRDLSSDNCMFRRLADGSVVGVLNDWDLSKCGDSTGQSSKSRTGTRPFMAIDLLVSDPPAHIERFDWESVMYVILWIACRFERGGHETNREALKGWLIPDLVVVREKKQSLLIANPPVISGHYAPLSGWISQLLAIFGSGYVAARKRRTVTPMLDLANVDKHPAAFNEETMDGHVTYELLWAVLRE